MSHRGGDPTTQLYAADAKSYMVPRAQGRDPQNMEKGYPTEAAQRYLAEQDHVDTVRDGMQKRKHAVNILFEGRMHAGARYVRREIVMARESIARAYAKVRVRLQPRINAPDESTGGGGEGMPQLASAAALAEIIDGLAEDTIEALIHAAPRRPDRSWR